MPILRIMQIPAVAHVHLQDAAESLRYRGIDKVDRIIAVGAFGEQALLAGGFPRDQVTMIANGVDFEALRRAEPFDVRARFGIGPDQLCLASVGSLIERKRPLLAIEAVARTQNCHLILIGSGELEAEARRLAAQRGALDRVHFAGETSDVGAWLRSGIDVMLAPSVVEALPLGVIEGLGLGLPIIGSDIGPHSELLASLPDALLFRPDSAEDLAARLVQVGMWSRSRLGAQPDRPQAVRARDVYSIHRYCDDFESLYRELAQKSGMAQRV